MERGRRALARHLRAIVGTTALVAAACERPEPRRAEPDRSASVEWTHYGGDPGGSRYSPAARITRENVRELEVAWVYRTGDFLPGGDGTRFEATPLLVGHTLYVSSPFGRVFALDAETGAGQWIYDPGIDLEADFGDFANRGVAHWLDRERREGDVCRRTIFSVVVDGRLLALDAVTGRPCPAFGRRGRIDLTEGLDPHHKGEYQVTSPPAVAGDVVIVGSAIADNQRTDAPSGVVRAFDARTGALRWAWDPIPRSPDAPGAETWQGPSALRTGAANVWSVPSVDPERDLVFLPTSSPSPDFYGGERLGSNAFANSVVTLRASTGEVVWHFQAVHHDLWDYDLPAQPVLVTLHLDGEDVPAVIQATKMGHLFVLHRETGEPLFPVEERAVPASTVAGERAWPTQPFPTRPEPLVPQRLSAGDAWGATPEDRRFCRERMRGRRGGSIFTPPSLEGTILFPGNIGGFHWGGVSYDPARGLLIGPTNRLAMLVTLVPRAELDAARHAHRGVEISSQNGTPYGMMRDVLFTPQGVPCNPPPWGTLTAVDVATGAVRWEVPLGYFPQLEGGAGSREWGSVNLGGALVTGGGLVFIAGTYDEHLRAFDVETGRELWSAPLPAGGNALPMTYELANGRQFVVIAAGGHARMRTRVGDHVVAFALPDPDAPAAEPADTSFEGTFRGHLALPDLRVPATLRLREDAAGGVSGDFEIREPGITGTLTGERREGRLSYTLAFRYPEMKCDGTVEGAAELANGGRLFVSELRVFGACTERQGEPGTMALRRR